MESAEPVYHHHHHHHHHSEEVLQSICMDMGACSYYFDDAWTIQNGVFGENKQSIIYYNSIIVTVLAETNLTERFVIFHYGRFYR